MSGGVIQLSAYGVQDIYLTSQPQITYYKKVYLRHTNFAREYIQQQIQGKQGPGNKVSVTLSRKGDLLSDLVFHINLPKLFNYNNAYDTYDASGVKYGRITELTDSFTHALFETMEIEIGGQVIDRHYGKWLTIWRQLTEPNPYGVQPTAFNQWLGDLTPGKEIFRSRTFSGTGYTYYTPDSGYPCKYDKMAYNYSHYGYGNGIYRTKIGVGGVISIIGTNDLLTLMNNPLVGAPEWAYVPLCFWFCNKSGLALPLIALQYHEVKLNFKYSALNQIVKSFVARNISYNLFVNAPDVFLHYSDNCDNNHLVPNYDTSIKMYAEYIYLDTVERKEFAQNAHEYLIDQLQYRRTQGNNVNLNFNHPVKELIWTGVNDFELKPQMVMTKGWSVPDGTPYKSYYSFSIGGIGAPAVLVPCNNYHYNSIPAWTNYTAKIVINGTDLFSERHITYFTRKQIIEHHTGYGSTNIPDALAVYSFALRPEEHQPSGTMNFSRFDTVKLVFGDGGQEGEYTVGTPVDDLNIILNDSKFSDFNSITLDIYAVNNNILRIMSGMGGLAYSN